MHIGQLVGWGILLLILVFLTGMQSFADGKLRFQPYIIVGVYILMILNFFGVEDAIKNDLDFSWNTLTLDGVAMILYLMFLVFVFRDRIRTWRWVDEIF